MLSRESGNPRKFEPEGKLVSSVDFELRQTLPHQHDRTRYLLLRPPQPGSATTEQHDLKALTQEDPNFAMASFQHMPSHELRVLAIRGVYCLFEIMDTSWNVLTMCVLLLWYHIILTCKSCSRDSVCLRDQIWLNEASEDSFVR